MQRRKLKIKAKGLQIGARGLQIGAAFGITNGGKKITNRGKKIANRGRDYKSVQNAYSEKLNGCFCVPCALFYHEVSNGNTVTKNLSSEPLIGFGKNTHKRLADHQNKTGTIHQKPIPIYKNFMKIMKCKMLAIKDQLKPDQVIINKTVLKSIIKTNIFLWAPSTFFT